MTLVPAFLTLMGEKSWYIPRWLDRLLPNITIESAARRDAHVPGRGAGSGSASRSGDPDPDPGGGALLLRRPTQREANRRLAAAAG